MPRITLITVVIALACPTSATALEIDCANASTQSQMNACAGQSYQRADDELNARYREINQRLGDDADAKRRFRQAQRAWIAFRDGECAFVASPVAGGSMYGAVYSGCLEELTRSRVEAFGSYLECEEGDLSCPVPRR